jgi:organic radical activating enzyme
MLLVRRQIPEQGKTRGRKMSDLVYRLLKRAEIRRQIDTRKSVQNNEPDRIADLLEEAAEVIEHLEKVKDLHRDAHHRCVELSREEYKKVLETMEKYKKVLIDIANDYVELSYDKARMQNIDHIKWAKEVLNETV